MPISGMATKPEGRNKMNAIKMLLMGTTASLGLLASAAAAEDVIKVGFPVPLTGDFAIYTEVDGARCMAEMINRDGGVNGMKFELLIQDTGSDTQTAISLSEKFLSEGIFALGTIAFSDTLIPVAQIVGAQGVTIIQAQSTQVEMHSGVVDNFLSSVAPDPYTATAAANYALSQGVKNVTIFTSDEGGSWSGRTPQWFADVIVENGGTLQATLNYTSGTTDWSPQIAELKALDPAPDAVYISWGMPDIGILIRQMRSAGLDAWVVGSDGFDDPSLDALAQADATILDKVFFGTLAPAVPGSRIDTFQKQCAEMGMPVNGLFPALGADMIMTVAYGVEAAGSTDPAAIREAIRSAESIPVMSVESISYNKTHSYALREIPVVGFKGGERVLLSQDVPANVPSWP
jgi:branched-chain amino acid transport system substrate-binding protein